MEPFAPDALTLELLQSEHANGTWVGHELLPIASRIRNQGGDADDYERWVMSSHLWSSYMNSTTDKAKKQDASLAGAWLKAKESKPFHLEAALTELAARVSAHTGWKGTTGSRDRAVALALISFCIEHNCFTRTLSSYELAKWTSGMSQRTVSRALTALTDIGLIREVERTDRRTSVRSTKRYQLSLRWGVSNTGSRSTGKASLSHELTPPFDLWSRRGLGPSAQRVHEVLTDDPVTARYVAERTGMAVPSVKRFLRILANHCLAGIKPSGPGGPTLYFAVATPLDAVADSLGIYGHLEIKRWEIEQRQNANKSAYPGSYRRLSTL